MKPKNLTDRNIDMMMMMPDEQLRDGKNFQKMYSEGSVDIQFIPVVFRSKRKMHMQPESAH